MHLLENGVPTLAVCALGLGDVLFCTPALALLRRELPESTIGFACQEPFRGVLTHNPDVDRTHPVPVGKSSFARWLRVRRLVQEIAAFGYGQAIVFYEHKNVERWIAAAGIAPSRTHVSPRRVDIHRREKHFGFVQEALGEPRGGDAGPLRVFPSAEDRAQAAEVLPRHLARGGAPFVVAHVGNSSSKRRRAGKRVAHRAWPRENWAECLPLLVERLDVDLVLTGSAQEGIVARGLVAGLTGSTGSRIHDVTGKTPPRVLAALLERAAAYVGADTGPTHLAAAVGTPVVGLYGPTDVVETVPLTPDPERLIVLRAGLGCSPCDRSVRKHCGDNACMRNLRAGRVVGSVGELIGRP